MKEESSIYKLKNQEFFDFLNAMLSNSSEFNEDDIIHSLLVMSLNPINYALADKLCSKFIKSENYNIKNMSIMAIGHIARVYKKLVNEDLYKNIKKIYLDKNNSFSSTASDTLDDIQIFLGIQKPTFEHERTDC